MKLNVLKHEIFFIALVFISLTTSVQATVVSFNKDVDGITCKLDKGLMKVEICMDNMIEVKYTSLPLFLDKPSLVITNEWKNTPGFTITENSSEIVITTAKIKVIVTKLSNSVKYTELNGNVILSEDGSEGKTMTAATIAGILKRNRYI